MGMGIIVLVVGLLIVAGIIGWLIGIYNSLIRLRNNIDKTWANIDVILMQRSDELPKLISSVKGYMEHEKETLQKLTEARTAFMQAQNPNEKLQADQQMTQAIKSLFAVAENYPDLKANQNFLQLQGRISGLENELADRREFYNDSVNVYNIKIQSFPDTIIAGMMGMQKREMYQVAPEDKRDVEVKF